MQGLPVRGLPFPDGWHLNLDLLSAKRIDQVSRSSSKRERGYSTSIKFVGHRGANALDQTQFEDTLVGMLTRFKNIRLSALVCALMMFVVSAVVPLAGGVAVAANCSEATMAVSSHVAIGTSAMDMSMAHSSDTSDDGVFHAQHGDACCQAMCQVAILHLPFGGSDGGVSAPDYAIAPSELILSVRSRLERPPNA